MENSENKYKKKYNKYKNKYHNLVQNTKLKGGGETVTIIAVILSIISLLGLGTGIYMNIDTIKEWFDSNSEKLNQIIKTEKIKQVNIADRARADRARARADRADNTQRENVAMNNPVESNHHGSTVNSLFKNYDNNTLILKKDSTLRKKIKERYVENKKKYAENKNIWYYLELLELLEMFDMNKPFHNKKVCGRGGKEWAQTDLCKKKEEKEEEEDILYEITNLQIKVNEISKKKELHWDFRTRHFYWSDNEDNKEDNNSIYIKYYPRFGDPTDISIYELNNDSFELKKNNEINKGVMKLNFKEKKEEE